MTKLRILSDLHLEFAPLVLEPAGEDVLVLTGDVGIHTDGAEWALAYARRTGVRVVMVAGNHEFYTTPKRRGHTVNSTLDDLREISIDSGEMLTLLENEQDIANIAGITFIGCTLWTDYALDGSPALAMLYARQAMNDHRLIFEEEHPFTPIDALRRHRSSRAMLADCLRVYSDGTPIVVVTHHLPSRRSIPAEYADSPVNPAYASNLDKLVARSGAALWVHGHTHGSADYALGDTRVICNPRGYAPHEVNPRFDPNLVIEI